MWWRNTGITPCCYLHMYCVVTSVTGMMINFTWCRILKAFNPRRKPWITGDNKLGPLNDLRIVTVYRFTILLWQHLQPCTTIYTTPYDNWRHNVMSRDYVMWLLSSAWCHHDVIISAAACSIHYRCTSWELSVTRPPPVQYGHLLFRALVVIAPMCLSSTPSRPITLPLPFHTVLVRSSPAYLPAMVVVVDLALCGLVQGAKCWCSLVERPNKKCLNVYDMINVLSNTLA